MSPKVLKREVAIRRKKGCWCGCYAIPCGGPKRQELRADVAMAEQTPELDWGNLVAGPRSWQDEMFAMDFEWDEFLWGEDWGGVYGWGEYVEYE